MALRHISPFPFHFQGADDGKHGSLLEYEEVKWRSGQSMGMQCREVCSGGDDGGDDGGEWGRECTWERRAFAIAEAAP
jgi:hypothetical protein